LSRVFVQFVAKFFKDAVYACPSNLRRNAGPLLVQLAARPAVDRPACIRRHGDTEKSLVSVPLWL